MNLIGHFQSYGVRSLRITTLLKSHADSQFLAKNGYKKHPWLEVKIFWKASQVVFPSKRLHYESHGVFLNFLGPFSQEKNVSSNYPQVTTITF